MLDVPCVKKIKKSVPKKRSDILSGAWEVARALSSSARREEGRSSRPSAAPALSV